MTNFPFGTDYLTTVELGDGPNAVVLPVYQHHIDTVREQCPDASEERINDLACRLAITEYDEARSQDRLCDWED